MDGNVLEEEKILERELAELDEKVRELAEKFEELASEDCDFGKCVFDPEMEDVQDKIAEVQRRKKMVQGVLDHLEGLT
jgi:hypothetical protein